jgi:hypothetical protein
MSVSKESMLDLAQDVLPQDQMTSLKARIVELVRERGAVKMCHVLPALLEGDTLGLISKRTIRLWADNYQEAISQLVTEGRLIDLEYVLPHMNYRVKSMLFPAGTEIKINAQ